MGVRLVEIVSPVKTLRHCKDSIPIMNNGCEVTIAFAVRGMFYNE
jgi:hypothetical protein